MTYNLPHHFRTAVKKALYLILSILGWALDHIPGPQSVVVLPKRPTYIARRGDGLVTIHIPTFLHDPNFNIAYSRGVKAAGWDYCIRWRVHVALWAATTTLYLSGDVVELGTGRGMVMSSVLSFLGDRSSLKTVWLFDRYSPYRVDRVSGSELAITSPHYASDAERVRDNFSEWPNVNVIQGEIPRAIESAEIGPIALLHIDLNAAQPEEQALRQLWPAVVKGGLVLLDDYANRGAEIQNSAMEDVAADLGVPILSLPTGQGLMMKS